MCMFVYSNSYQVDNCNNEEVYLLHRVAVKNLNQPWRTYIHVDHPDGMWQYYSRPAVPIEHSMMMRVLKTFTVQYRSHESHVVFEHMKYG